MNHPIKTAVLAIIAILSLGTASSAEIMNATNFSALEKDLASVAPLLAKDEVSYQDVASLEETLHKHIGSIYDDINTRRDERGNLKPEWQPYITKLGNTLEPYEPEMIETAFRSLGGKLRRGTGQLNRLSTPLHRLLVFAKPDAEIESRLRGALEEFPRAKWAIYRQLLELRLLKESDIGDMVAMGEGIEDPKEKIKWAEELAFYGSDAGMSVFEEIMAKPFDPAGSVNERGDPESNESFGSYIPVSRAIDHLGPKAERLLPLINSREKEVYEAYEKLFGTEFADSGIRLFTQMKIYINGKQRPIPSARNGSGLLYRPGEPPINIEERKTGKNPDSSSGPERRDLRSKSVGEPSRSSPGGGFPSWLLVAGLAVVISGAVIVVRRMKRK